MQSLVVATISVVNINQNKNDVLYTYIHSKFKFINFDPHIKNTSHNCSSLLKLI